ncbi:MAG: hypothetical protein C7B44_05000 [Sulfobacillus thermosulfidooxidans]|uniref:Transcriptional regulator n=1 Tax=Sulfobacillus thermotolerans TaxID=338644 RepID=A0ABM6RUN3_9FIRM|nr:hypothetical protein [Sulfobacillus sp. hq2]AUW95048.1 hypothetical protein BXT84_14700 [Sulfobacillus thermotolerans]MCY0908542.1 hypothetical protein [Sulfobacillus thermotolerans]POB10350.1 hypothetical protein CO251_10385 [Sulfobacillus sp. hq2]PSR37202.1 MAG: hypothetical protein C7B44_05000 [Sulfobacillus thermosulfidooxidans]
MWDENGDAQKMPQVLAALWVQRRAAAIGTLAGYARLDPSVVARVLTALTQRGWVHEYRLPGQPPLYLWAGLCTEDMLKTADMIRRIAWDLPLDSQIV